MKNTILIPLLLALLVPIAIMGVAADNVSAEDERQRPNLKENLNSIDESVKEKVKEKIGERTEKMAERWWEEDRETGNWGEKFDFRGKLGAIDFDKPLSERIRDGATVDVVMTEEEVMPLVNKLQEVKDGKNNSDMTSKLLDKLFGSVPITGLGSWEGGKIFIGVHPTITDEHLDKLKNVLKEQWGGIVSFEVGRVGYLELLSGTAGTASTTQATGTPVVMTHDTDTPIPDNRSPVFIPFTVTETGTIADVEVTVDIKHTYIGDLSVALLSPQGSGPTLHHRTGGGTDNLTKTYTMSTSTSMQGHLSGINMTGTWKLSVIDLATEDTGYVDSVSLTLTPVAAAPAPAPAIIFQDDFESGLGKWVESGDTSWRSDVSDEYKAPAGLDYRTNLIAEADDCDAPCILTLKDPIDLSRYDAATLTFDRFVDSFINTQNDWFKVEVHNGTWTQLFKWSDGYGDTDAWESESVDLTPYLSANFTIRFTAQVDSISEDFGIDNVKITADSSEKRTCKDNPTLPIMGGDKVLFVQTEQKQGCGTITLGGVTIDGRQGFVTTGHIGYNSTDWGVFHYVDPAGQFIDGILGKAYSNPTLSATDYNPSDAMFVEYMTDTCTLIAFGKCFHFDYNPSPPIKPNSIKTNTGAVSVSGTLDPYTGLGVKLVGGLTGTVNGTVYNPANITTSGGVKYAGWFVYVDTPLQGGDSGGPVFDPVSKKMVGLMIGKSTINGKDAAFIGEWSEAEKHLGFTLP